MICRIDDAVFRGRTVTISREIAPTTLAQAVRDGDTTTPTHTVVVRAQRPPAVHQRVGCIYPDMGLRPKTALAAAGRARGLSTSHDASLTACLEKLEQLPAPAVETATQRERVAAESAETARLREQVAETRGRLAARRDLDAATDDLEARLEAAASDLAEAETSAVAAEQRLDRKREAARRARETLDRRLRLEDELANRRREARAELVDRLRDAFVSAVTAVPDVPAMPPADPFAVDPVTAALAIARLADFDAPVVVACDRFDDADAASAWLGAPVILVRHLRI